MLLAFSPILMTLVLSLIFDATAFKQLLIAVCVGAVTNTFKPESTRCLTMFPIVSVLPVPGGPCMMQNSLAFMAFK